MCRLVLFLLSVMWVFVGCERSLNNRALNLAQGKGGAGAETVTVLAGDIGGTKSLVFLARVNLQSQTFEQAHSHRLVSANFSSLQDLLEAYRKLLPEELEADWVPQAAAFGVAGPVTTRGGSNGVMYAAINNLKHKGGGWLNISSAVLKSVSERLFKTEMSHLVLLNDFAANFYGLSLAAPAGGSPAFVSLNPNSGVSSRFNPSETLAIVGAGTGLGQAYATGDCQKKLVHATEGGHASFAPADPLGVVLLEGLRSRVQGNHVAVEQIVSGNGISNIFDVLLTHNGVSLEELPEQLQSAHKKWKNGGPFIAGEISAVAQTEGSETLSNQTLNIFFKLYGAEVGNYALKVMPKGGIFVAGGVAAKNAERMKSRDFWESYLDKGPMAALLAEIPVYLVTDEELGLKGAAVAAASRQLNLCELRPFAPN